TIWSGIARESNWPRAEIAARPVQLIAARRARGDVAGGLPLGARGDVGAQQVGREVRTITRADGTTERWWQPRLAPWEVPRRDPAEPRPNAPDVAARRRAARQRWRARQRARNATQHAGAGPHAGTQTAA